MSDLQTPQTPQSAHDSLPPAFGKPRLSDVEFNRRAEDARREMRSEVTRGFQYAQNKFSDSQLLGSVAAHALFALISGGQSLYVTIPLAAVAQVARGIEGNASLKATFVNAAVEMDELGLGTVGGRERIAKRASTYGFMLGLSQGIARQGGYLSIAVATALDAVGYAGLRVGSALNLPFADASQNKLLAQFGDKQWAFANTVRAAMLDMHLIAPKPEAVRNINKNTLIARR